MNPFLSRSFKSGFPLLFSVLTLLLVGCQSNQHPLVSAKEGRKTLSIGTSADFAPFCFIEEGKLTGFEIDIANEVARRIDVDLEWHDLPFESLIAELSVGKLQIAAGAVNPTPERCKRVFFSHDFLEPEPWIALALKGVSLPVETSDHQAWQQLKIVVCSGYSSEHYVTDEMQQNPLRLTSPIEALLALQSGQADVFICSKRAIKAISDRDMQRWQQQVIAQSNESCALPISKKNPELVPLVNEALKCMKNEGVIASLIAKWGLE